MPANIVETDGKSEMMYVGEVPWHGLGTKLDNPATSKEAIEAASLDWTVETRPVYIKAGDVFSVVPNKAAVMRIDTKTVFNILSEKYRPVQNRDAFKFFDGVIGEGQAVYHTAGALGEGQRVWIMAKLPQDIEVTKDDVLQNYILLVNSHDGSEALQMMFTPVRVVCQNTLSIALNQVKGEKFYARHTTNVFNRMSSAREILGLTKTYIDNFAKVVDMLVAKTWKDNDMTQMAKTIYKLDDENKVPADYNAAKRYAFDQTVELFIVGKGNDLVGVRGTAWAALNAVTEFVDHYRPVRGNVKETAGKVDNLIVAGKRLDSAWFGSGADIKVRALDYLVEASKN